MKQFSFLKLVPSSLFFALLSVSSFGQTPNANALFRTKTPPSKTYNYFTDPVNWEFSNDNGANYISNGSSIPTSTNSVEIRDTVELNSNFIANAGTTFSVVSPGVLLISPVNSLTIAGIGHFNNQSIIFVSNSAGTGRFGPLTGTLDGATNVTTERNIPLGKRAYRHLAPGVMSSGSIFTNWQNNGVADTVFGTHITGMTGTPGVVDPITGFDETATGAPSLYTYAAGTPNFTPVATTKGQNLNALQGYRLFIRGTRFADLALPNNSGAGTPNIDMNRDVTLRATGTLVAGNVTYDMTGGKIASGAADPAVKLAGASADFSFIANPYWSPVDFGAVTLTDMQPSYWAWVSNSGNRGAYSSFNVLTGLSSGDAAIDRYLRPGQAIFVQNAVTGFGGNPSVVFTESAKTDQVLSPFRQANQTPARLVINLVSTNSSGNAGTVQDAATAAFRDDFSAAIGREDDAKFTNPDENIALVRDDHVLGVDARPTVTTEDKVDVRMWQLFSNNNYSLKLAGYDFAPTVTAYVEDHLENKTYAVNLSGTTVIPFSFKASDSASFYDRFSVVFKNSLVLPLQLTSVKAIQANAGIKVEWNVATESNIKNYEVERSNDGSHFVKAATVVATNNNNSSVSYNWLDAAVTNGTLYYYRIKALGTAGDSRYSPIVKILAGNLAGGVSLSPNPVVNNRFNLQFTSMPAGKYKIVVYNKGGQQVYFKAVTKGEGSSSESVQLPRSIPSGNYTFVLSNGQEQISKQNIFLKNN